MRNLSKAEALSYLRRKLKDGFKQLPSQIVSYLSDRLSPTQKAALTRFIKEARDRISETSQEKKRLIAQWNLDNPKPTLATFPKIDLAKYAPKKLKNGLYRVYDATTRELKKLTLNRVEKASNEKRQQRLKAFLTKKRLKDFDDALLAHKKAKDSYASQGYKTALKQSHPSIKITPELVINTIFRYSDVDTVAWIAARLGDTPSLINSTAFGNPASVLDISDISREEIRKMVIASFGDREYQYEIRLTNDGDLTAFPLNQKLSQRLYRHLTGETDNFSESDVRYAEQAMLDIELAEKAELVKFSRVSERTSHTLTNAVFKPVNKLWMRYKNLEYTPKTVLEDTAFVSNGIGINDTQYASGRYVNYTDTKYLTRNNISPKPDEALTLTKIIESADQKEAKRKLVTKLVNKTGKTSTSGKVPKISRPSNVSRASSSGRVPRPINQAPQVSEQLTADEMHELNMLLDPSLRMRPKRTGGAYLPYKLARTIDNMPVNAIRHYQIYPIVECNEEGVHVISIASLEHCLSYSVKLALNRDELDNYSDEERYNILRFFENIAHTPARDFCLPSEVLTDSGLVMTKHLAAIAAANHDMRLTIIRPLCDSIAFDYDKKTYNADGLGPKIKIACLRNHYFVFEKTNFYLIADDQLVYLKKAPKDHNIRKRRLNSLDLIIILIDLKYLVPMSGEEILSANAGVISRTEQRDLLVGVVPGKTIYTSDANEYLSSTLPGYSDLDKRQQTYLMEVLPLRFPDNKYPIKHHHMAHPYIPRAKVIFNYEDYRRYYLDIETMNIPLGNGKSKVSMYQAGIRKVADFYTMDEYITDDRDEQVVAMSIINYLLEHSPIIKTKLPKDLVETHHTHCATCQYNIANNDYEIHRKPKLGDGFSYHRNVYISTYNLGFDVKPFLRICGYSTNFGRGANTKGITMKYKGMVIEWRDISAHTPPGMTLKAFAQSYKLPVTKGHFPYPLMCPEALPSSPNAGDERLFSINECMSAMPVGTSPDEFLSEVIDAKAYRIDGEYNPDDINPIYLVEHRAMINLIELSRAYLHTDLELTHKSAERYRKSALEDTKQDGIEPLDIDNYPTAASFAKAVFEAKGGLDGCYQVTSLLRMFILSCSTGGRVMSNRNQIIKVEGQGVTVIDACSLYPTAMKMLGGTLKGAPQSIPDGWTFKDLEDADSYFVECRIVRLNKRIDFPLTVIKQDGKIVNTNEMDGRVIRCNKWDIEAYVKYNGCVLDEDIVLLSGYFFDSGRNMKMGEIVTSWYNDRLKLKKLGDEKQAIKKSLLNSTYGKFSQKHYETKQKCFTNEAEANKFITLNYDSVVKRTEIDSYGSEGKVIYVEYKEPNIMHGNFAHIGSEILSVARLIMGEVFDICHDLNIDIYYTDTDSIHMPYDRYAELIQEYEVRNGHKSDYLPLDGNQMGQFHPDIEPDVEKGWKLDNSYPVTADLCYYLGKKVYMLKYSYQASKDGDSEIFYGYKIACKGVPESSLYVYAESLHGGLEELFERLYMGETITCDLLAVPGDFSAKRFKPHTASNMTLFVRNEFTRDIVFKPEIAEDRLDGVAIHRWLVDEDGVWRKVPDRALKRSK